MSFSTATCVCPHKKLPHAQVLINAPALEPDEVQRVLYSFGRLGFLHPGLFNTLSQQVVARLLGRN